MNKHDIVFTDEQKNDAEELSTYWELILFNAKEISWRGIK